MKPFKGVDPIAMWVLRIAMLLFAFTYYFATFKSFNLESLNFWFALVNLIFCGLLFVAGFVKDQQLTLWSALIMVIVSIFGVVMEFSNGITPNMAIYALTGGISLLFLSRGNR